MTLHFKTGGVWTTVNRPYVKRNGVWTPVKETWRKSAGVWVRHFLWDITPPSPPLISLDLVPGAAGRYLNVSMNIPGSVHDPNVKLVRILVSTTGYPATQFGGTYYTTRDTNYPNEAWSDWYYGPGHDHPDTHVLNSKQYPINQAQPNLPAGRYYFQAWTQDINGNWSVGNYNSIAVPKTGVGTNLVNLNARFQADYSGTYVSGTGFLAGDLRQSVNPSNSKGMYFYGTQMTASIGAKYGNANATITMAQIFLRRVDTDGAATANVFMFRHAYGSPGALSGEPTITEIVKLGTLAKGEAKWFPVPASYYPDLISGDTKGLGFFYKDPTHAAASAADYSVIDGLSEDVRRAGELYVVWTESPS